MRTVLVFAVMAIVVGAAAPAMAQSRGYVLGTAGYGSLWDDEGSLGKGAVFGGAFGWNLTDDFSIEGAVINARHERLGSLSWRGEPRSITARAIYRLGDPSARARLFVAGGGGYFRYPGTFVESTFAAPGLTPQFVSRDWLVTGRALEVGTGVDLTLGPLLLIRPEVWLAFGSGERTSPAPEPFYTMPRFALSAGIKF